MVTFAACNEEHKSKMERGLIYNKWASYQ